MAAMNLLLISRYAGMAEPISTTLIDHVRSLNGLAASSHRRGAKSLSQAEPKSPSSRIRDVQLN